MFISRPILFILATLFSSWLSASPLTVLQIDITDMRQSECLKHAQAAFQSLQFLDIKISDNTHVFAEDPPYYAAVLCHAEKETAYVSISGKNMAQRNQFMQQIHTHFKQTALTKDICQLTVETWANCDNKVVKLRGYMAAPHQILPAPMLNLSIMPDMPQEDSAHASVQNYMNVRERQVILLSQNAIPCTSGIEAVGRLESISLGGAPHTPMSYQGWSLHVDSYQCLDHFGQ